MTEKGYWIPKPVMIRTPSAKNYICSVCGAEGHPEMYCNACAADMRDAVAAMRAGEKPWIKENK